MLPSWSQFKWNPSLIHNSDWLQSDDYSPFISCTYKAFTHCSSLSSENWSVKYRTSMPSTVLVHAQWTACPSRGFRDSISQLVSIWSQLFVVSQNKEVWIVHTQSFIVFSPLENGTIALWCKNTQELKVRKATRVFFVLLRNGKNRWLKLIVAKFLKCHCGCDRWKNRDIKFDGKTRRELHLNKLPEFIKVLEWCDHFQDI